MILIYQMGKVGSTFINSELAGSKSIHVLFGGPVCPPMRKYSKKRTWLRFYANRIVNRIRIARQKRVRIVSLVREPIGRNISMFFQNLPFWYLQYYDQSSDLVAKSHDEHLLQNIFMKAFNHDYPLEWFDNELFKLTGIDVYTHEFPRDVGYVRLKKGKFDVFIGKYEFFADPQFRKALDEFVGKKLDYAPANAANSKWYSPLYSRFKKEFSPDESYLNRMLDSRYSRHFYSTDEIDALRKKYREAEQG